MLGKLLDVLRSLIINALYNLQEFRASRNTRYINLNINPASFPFPRASLDALSCACARAR